MSEWGDWSNHPQVREALGIDSASTAAARARGRQAQRLGEQAELLVKSELTRRGFRMIEAVNVPMKPIYRDGELIAVKRLAKVSGDWRAVGPSGQSVLVEVKARPGRLQYHVIERHQVRALQQHQEAGGLSLVAWYDTDAARVHIIEWPHPALVPGSSVTEAELAE